MPAHKAVFTGSQLPRYHKKKKNTTVNRKNPTQTQKIQNEQREKHRYRRCLIYVFVGLAIAAAVILAGLLPALIINSTRSSTTNETDSATNTGVSSSGNLNGTTISSVTSASSSSSISNSASTVSTGSSASTSASAYGFTAGGVVLSSTTAWYGYEQVTLSCSVSLINITITITVQKTVNATYWNAYSTFWSGTVNQAYLDNGTQIIYTWTIVSGQTIQPSGIPYTAQAQFKLYGVNQITSADIYSVTATTATGLTNTISGNF